MREEIPPFDENELSAEDLAVLQAFDAMEGWPSPSAESGTDPQFAAATMGTLPDTLLDDMLMVFVAEIDEDIARLRRALNQLEQEDHIDPRRFSVFRQVGHKIRGTAGAVECHTLASIAHYIEIITEQITAGKLFPLIGVNALTSAVSSLEETLQNLTEHGEESTKPLATLEAELEQLNVSVQLDDKPADHTQRDVPPTLSQPITAHEKQTSDIDATPQKIFSANNFVQVDTQRLQHLLTHVQQLAELHTPLESARKQMDEALRELHAVRERLLQLEPKLFTLLVNSRASHPAIHTPPSSSLMARILSRTRRDPHPLRKSNIRTRSARIANTKPTDTSIWDKLEIEQYTEQELLINRLREEILNLNGASSRLNMAFAQLRETGEEYMAQSSTVHSDTLLLRLVPLYMLLPRIQQLFANNPQIQFEAFGESIEIDQDILQDLSQPLLQLLETCCIDTMTTEIASAQEPFRTWLYAQPLGNEILLEVGFSKPVHGGALEAIREPIQRLNGTLSLQRNETGGVSFHLRLPRSRGTVRSLLVRAQNWQVLVPFSQVLRIVDDSQKQFDVLYRLNELLGFPTEQIEEQHIQPVLVLLQGSSLLSVEVGIAVDEVVGEVELVLKQLSPHLQRPGIASAAIDGSGHVLLALDLPELVKYYTLLQHTSPTGVATRRISMGPENTPKVLLADDSAYFRQSLQQILVRAKYDVLEARDGLEALEKLMQYTPDVFLLDIEMPQLNGYDLLGIMRLYPALASVKIIMLTSRSSEKHMQHALELGAHAYLTKPCSQETLLETIKKLLDH